MSRFLGIDIGGTKCAVCIGDDAANVLAREMIPTECSPQETLTRLSSIAKTMLTSVDEVQSIGIVCGGPLDAAAGVVLSPPNLPGWDEICVTHYFQEQLGVPAFLQNDANAGALAEWRHGAGIGTRNMMFCTMGTGFGCGLILDGKLYEGANGNAGELGHVRLTGDGPEGYGKNGSVEGYCGGGGIAQLARTRLQEHLDKGDTSVLTEVENTSALNVAEAARAGDKLALQILCDVGDMLGRALSVSVDILNVERIVIGSIFVRCEEFIRPAMEIAMQQECLPGALAACLVKPAELGERIGDVAALTVAHIGIGV